MIFWNIWNIIFHLIEMEIKTNVYQEKISYNEE